MTTQLTRRTLLKQVSLGAGATLLAPALARAAAHAAGDAKAAAPLRVVFVTQSNGMSPAHVCPKGWKVEGNGQPPANAKTQVVPLKDQELHPALEPLAAHKDRLTLVRGLSGKVAVSDHSANLGALGCYSARRGAVDQTIDSAVADALPGLFKHVLLGASTGRGMNYSLSAAGPGKANPIVCDPDLAYRALFGTAAGGTARAAFDRRTKLLDFMADDVRRSRAALAAPEREKFDQYVAAYETMHARQADILAREDAIRRAAPVLGDKQTSDLMSLALEAQFAIAAAALGAGLTNVVTLSSGGGGQGFGSFPEFGLPELHGIGHGGKSTDGKPSEQCFVELRQFHSKLIAGLVKGLSAVKEGTGTAMDNTLVVYLSDSGEGHHPRLEEWPVVLVGDLGGKFQKPGRFVQLPGYRKSDGHRTMASLYLSILDVVGRPRKSFGTADPTLKDVDQTARLPELLT